MGLAIVIDPLVARGIGTGKDHGGKGAIELVPLSQFCIGFLFFFALFFALGEVHPLQCDSFFLEELGKVFLGEDILFKLATIGTPVRSFKDQEEVFRFLGVLKGKKGEGRGKSIRVGAKKFGVPA